MQGIFNYIDTMPTDEVNLVLLIVIIILIMLKP